jgi:hypothetical protein
VISHIFFSIRANFHVLQSSDASAFTDWNENAWEPDYLNFGTRQASDYNRHGVLLFQF